MEALWPPASGGACALPAMPKAASAAGVAAGVRAAPDRAVTLTPETQAQFALMRRCQADEPGAFEELVRHFQPRVQSAIRGILRNSNDAEDIAQQVFAKIYFSRSRFDFRSAVATWIYKIAVNECYDHLRKQRVRRAILLADLPEEEAARIANQDPAARPGPVLGMAPPGVARQVETREIAAKLLAAVSPEDRILLVMKEVEGHSIQELAEILGLNENTVKVKLFRARQKLLAMVKRKRL